MKAVILFSAIFFGLSSGLVEAKESLIKDSVNVFTRAPVPKNAVTPLIGFRGILMVEGNCLYFSNKDRTRKLLAIWPYGTTIRNNRVVISRKNGKEIYISPQLFFAGGGFVNKLTPKTYKKYASCPSKDYLVVNIL